MKQIAKQAMQRALFSDGVRRLRLAAVAGYVDEQAIAELWLGWGNPQWCATTEMLSTLAQLARQPRVRTILECGGGISSIVLALVTAPMKTRIVSLEADAEWHAIMVQKASRLGLHNLDVRHAPVTRYEHTDWYAREALHDVTQVDLFLCDGPPGDTRGSRAGALEHVLPILAPNAAVVLDDVDREPERMLAIRFGEALGATTTIWGRPQRQFAVVERR